jgi:hypothetical protein
VVSSSIENLENMLIWTQLRPDEGPNFGGDYGPYIQVILISFITISDFKKYD